MHYTSRSVYEHIATKENDPIVERRTCSISGEPFALYQSDLDYYTKMSPTFDGQIFDIPLPTLCPEERRRRRMAYRNERAIYRRTCDATGKRILSAYSPEKPYTIYEYDYRRSDKRDPMEYWIIYDTSRSFFKQHAELQVRVPKMNLINGQWNEKSTYTNQTDYLKNCYLCFNSDSSENCLYCNTMNGNKDCIDCTYIYYSQQCYSCVNVTNWFNLLYCTEVNNSSDCMFSLRCQNCTFCFWCVNLANQSYHIYNKPVPKEDYHKLVAKEKEKRKQDPSWYQKKLTSLCNKHAQRATYTIKSKDNIAGNNLYESSHTRFSFNIWQSKYLRYCSMVFEDCEDCYDFDIRGVHVHKVLESITVGLNAHTLGFCLDCWESVSNLWYCYSCISCSDCFWCVWLRNKKYCIGNKQYTKESYEIEVARIIASMKRDNEWGEFFPTSSATYGYNETVAMTLYPLSKEDALKRWLPRQEEEYFPTIPEHAQKINWEDLWESRDKDESVCKKVILCKETGRPYMIQKRELAFYQKHDLPLPQVHENVRYARLRKSIPPFEIHLRTCDKTTEEILSNYPSWTPYQVIKESEYQQEVFG